MTINERTPALIAHKRKRSKKFPLKKNNKQQKKMLIMIRKRKRRKKNIHLKNRSREQWNWILLGIRSLLMFVNEDSSNKRRSGIELYYQLFWDGRKKRKGEWKEEENVVLGTWTAGGGVLFFFIRRNEPSFIHEERCRAGGIYFILCYHEGEDWRWCCCCCFLSATQRPFMMSRQLPSVFIIWKFSGFNMLIRLSYGTESYRLV